MQQAGFNFASDVAYRRARETPRDAAVLAIDREGRAEAWTFERVATEKAIQAGEMRVALV